MPHEDKAGPFTFGKKMRAKLSGWADQAISDKKLCKATAATRLLALTLATQADASVPAARASS